MKTEAELRLIMPTSAELRHPWKQQEWWSIVHGREGKGGARIYLNGHGTDDELRFIVWHPMKDRLPCQTCDGKGRILRPQITRGKASFLSARLPSNVDHDPMDVNGLRRCLFCSRGYVDPIYGASNSFIRIPGLDRSQLSQGSLLGSRGLPHPTREDVQVIMLWIEDLLKKLKNGQSP